MQEKLPDFALGDQQHFLNLLPRFLQDLVLKLPTDYLELDEPGLRRLVFGDALAVPHPTHERLRISLWDEYDRAVRHRDRQIDIARAIYGTCSMGYFVNKFCAVSENVAYIVQPPTDYTKSLKEMVQLSLSQFRDVLALPNTKPNGDPNTKLIEAKTKIFQHVEMRLKGAIIQRIDQRNINVNFDGDPTQAPREVTEGLTMDEVDEKLKALEQESERLNTPAANNRQVSLMPAQTMSDVLLKQLVKEEAELEA
jgi:hypothetical protein